jgi:hypothetical protein
MTETPYEIAQRILKKIDDMEKARGGLRKYGDAKALAIAEYSRDLAIATLKISSGKPVQIGDEIAKDVKATNLNQVAKGAVWEAEYRKELAEANYKLAITNLECLEVETNALQSVNRWLDVSTEHGRVRNG